MSMIMMSSCRQPAAQLTLPMMDGGPMGTHWNLLLFLIFIYILGVHSCVREGGCLGGRPLTPNGCCPVGVGMDCGEEVGLQCDTDLGFRCVDMEGNVTTVRGRCTGQYNLHVTDTGTNSVTLEWNHFLPADYYFEYVLLFRDQSYSEDAASWTLWDIGLWPRYTVTKLKAGTLYFMRLALWVDARATVLGNMSEVIWVLTDSATHCSHNGQLYELGHVVDNCEDICTCTATGDMQCVPSCPESGLPDVPEGCSLVFEEECSCNATVSCPHGGPGSCEYKGDNYTDGSSWMDMTNCTFCTCEAGRVMCEVSCQEPEVPEECVNPRHTTEEHGCCPIIICDNTESVGVEECHNNGTTYHVGASFTSDCSLCVCTHGGHVNCSLTACPVLQLPIASIFCPNPHMRRDSCCDNVYCTEENPDPQAFLSRLMALSFGPDTLTISFDVDHVTPSDTVTQDRYEVMTSDGQDGTASWTSRTYTPTTLNADDNVSSPSDLLHADSAIQVDDRVYITLDGLRPSTTYYVRVEPVVKRDMGVTESVSNTTLTGFFVAKTMERDLTCVVRDVTYQHGAVISNNCQEICRCVSGEVICQHGCPEEQLIMAPSITCPQPRLLASNHSCCKTWRCLPQDDGCVYKNIILSNDEVVSDGLCGPKCKCKKGGVTCTPLCPPVAPAPRPDCTLTNVTNSCCPVWMCPRETLLPTGMSLGIQIAFHGDCSKNDTFKTALRTAFGNRTKGHLPCADRESSFFVRCWVSDIVVMCPHLDHYRKRRQTTHIELVAVIAANTTEANNESKIETSLNETEHVISTMFTAGNSIILGNAVKITSADVHSFGISHLCPGGFVYQQNTCVPDYLYPASSQLQQQNLTLTVANISSHSATLSWPSLSTLWLPYVTALLLKFGVTSSSEWSGSVMLDPMTTNHTLRNLSASQIYRARLVAVTISTSSDMVALSTVQFTTGNQEVLTTDFTLGPLQVSMGMTSVTLSWPALSSDVISTISTLKVTYHQSLHLENGKDLELDPNASQVTLTGLQPETAYISQFVVCLVNMTTITMAPLHFVTKATESSEVPVIPLLATCAALVVLSLAIPIVFIVWRRMRRKPGRETAFENKTYGINISSLCATRAKNDCARPQDTENGSAVASSTGTNDCTQQA